jgi:hypothetical protein
MIRGLDLLARAGLAAGISMMLQPWWAAGFRWGFFVTAAFTLLHIATSRMQTGADRGRESPPLSGREG